MENTEQQIKHNIDTTEQAEHYDEAMLTAFVQKPNKMPFYKQALQKMTITGKPNLKWTWSWWGFFGGWAFLLYRKAYLPAVAFFFASIISMAIPLAPLILMIILGGVAPYFVVKRYDRLKSEIEGNIEDSNLRIEAMKQVGGYHSWIAWVLGIIYGVMLIIMIGGILSAVSNAA